MEDVDVVLSMKRKGQYNRITFWMNLAQFLQPR